MDTGSVAFMLLATAMIFFMTPGLAFFYGGLGRRKNVISTMMMSVVPIGIAILMWILVGYSLSFSGQNPLIGDFGAFLMQGVSESSSTKGYEIPDLLFAVYQMMFSIITVGIATGSIVGRMRFSPLVIWISLWLLLVYYPLAHMVWGGGLLAQMGALDFAGGNVVHISSGVAGLVMALMVGKRVDYERIAYRPHNVPFVMLGTAILSFGWIGFNAGSALGANASAIHALATTLVSSAAGLLSWLLIEKLVGSKPSLVGASTGLVAGLVAITPGAGYVSVGAALIIGALVSPLCYFAISVLKKKWNYDDALDAFGCHGVGGIFGGLMTALFTDPLLTPEAGNVGLFFGSSHLLLATLFAIVLTMVWSGGVTWLILFLVKQFQPLRVTERQEILGLDESEHEETAYPTFLGLDT